jgi:transcriptional regulator with XRE-family HTH domain
MKDDLAFGEALRARRLAQAENDPTFSLRKVAARVGIEPSYLSKIERGEQPPPGEQTICRLADELGENPDALLALAGKVSGDLLEIIRERPTVVAELLRTLRRMSAKRVSEISRQIRDGEW